MRLLIVFSLAVAALSDAPPPRYRPPHPPPLPPSQGYGAPSGGPGFGGGYGGGPCGKGQIRHVDGNCVSPLVNRNVFSYTAPQQHFQPGPPPVIPKPRVDHNIVLVRTPEQPERPDPIIIPPPKQKTVVYVLNKNGQIEGQKVIEVPHSPDQPEVYYVNYDEGDNPTLPGGINLKNALQSAAPQQGQVIGGGGGGGGYGSGPVPSPSSQYGPP